MLFRVLQALQQEQITNVFFDDWKDLGTSPEADDWSGKVSEGLTLHQAFTDQVHTKDRRISCVNWHPALYGKLQKTLCECSEGMLHCQIMQRERSSALYNSLIHKADPLLITHLHYFPPVITHRKAFLFIISFL